MLIPGTDGQGVKQFLELGAAFLFSAAIGLEREIRHKSAGLRTETVVHGGFPGFRDDLPDAHGNVYQWLILPAQPQAPKARLLDGPNFWIPQEPEGFSPHGYVVLDFDDDTVWETYRVPNNIGLLKVQL